MSWTTRTCVVTASLAALIGGGQANLPSAAADEAPQQDLHNVMYRATIDGVSRGATITFNMSDTEVQTTNPTMLPGQPFEANAVLTDPTKAGMQVSIRWPYTAKLRCEILVDDAITAQADQYIAPRLLPQDNDPGYGVLSCGGPLANASAVAAGEAAASSNTAPGAPPPVQAPPPS
jgi:hypothetical protein